MQNIVTVWAKFSVLCTSLLTARLTEAHLGPPG